MDDADPAGAGALRAAASLNARWQRRAQRGLQYTIDAQRVGPRLPARARLPAAPRRHDAQRLRQLLHLHRQAPLLPPRVPGRARVHDLPQRRRRARERAVGGLGAVGHEGRRRRLGRAQGVPRERARALHDRRAPPSPPAPTTSPTCSSCSPCPPARALRTDVDLRAGTFFDGTRAQVILTPTWNVSPPPGAGRATTSSRACASARAARRTTSTWRGCRSGPRSTPAPRPTPSCSTTPPRDRLDLNVRLRYDFAEGTDLWLVYNEGLDTDDLDRAGRAARAAVRPRAR